MNRFRFPSYSKINWYLEILGRRPDGFHEVITVLQTIDWSDWIELEPLDSGEIELEATGRVVAAGEDNLLVRAARLLRSSANRDCGVKIRLLKSLPVGGGLGGGSANAATLLLFLNQLWRCGSDRGELGRLGARLGSDVPFFLVGGMAVASGRGERLEPLPDGPAQEILLLAPPFPIATAEAYRLGRWGPLQQAPSELTSEPLDNTILRFRGKVERGESVQDLAENDFDGPLHVHFPSLARARQQMMEAGCERVLTCGSGSTLLGLAAPQRLAEAADRLSGGDLGEIRICRTLPRRQYWQALKQSGLRTDKL